MNYLLYGSRLRLVYFCYQLARLALSTDFTDTLPVFIFLGLFGAHQEFSILTLSQSLESAVSFSVFLYHLSFV